MDTMVGSSESEWESRMRELNEKLERFIDFGPGGRPRELVGFDCEVINKIEEVLQTIEYSRKERFDYTTKEIKAKSDRVKQLENELKNAKVKIHEKQARIDEQDIEIDKQSRELEKLQSHVEYLIQQLDPKNAELTKVQKDLKTFLTDYKMEKEMNEMNLRQNRFEYEKKIEKLRRDLTEEHAIEIGGLKTEYEIEKMRLTSRIQGFELELKIAEEKIRNLMLKRRVSSSEIDYYAELLETDEIAGRLNARTNVTPSTRPIRPRPNLRRRLFAAVTIEEIDPNGEFIKLHNKSNEDQSMRGGQLRHKVDDCEEVTFEFPDTFVLKKNAHVTIWGSGAGRGRRSPSHLMLTSADSWGSGDHTQTTLVNDSEQVMASHHGHVQTEIHGPDDSIDDDDSRDNNPWNRPRNRLERRSSWIDISDP